MALISDLSAKVIERLSLYRQLLLKYRFTKGPHINSADLSRLTGATQESVRRDLMLIGCQSSNIRKGYEVNEMIDCINSVLNPYEPCRMALVGDNDAFTETLLYEYENEKIRLVAVFDFEPVSEHIHHDDIARFRFDVLHDTIRNLDIKLVILNVPGAYTHQTVEILIKAGVRGIINLSPVHIDTDRVYVENLNMITAIEKAAFFMKWRQYV
ncbi:MAG: winged-helix domain-containing protein [Bacteroidales bacterium]|nr:winged-helix domain-containing protein [Bacteroidales bacterium]